MKWELEVLLKISALFWEEKEELNFDSTHSVVKEFGNDSFYKNIFEIRNKIK